MNDSKDEASRRDAGRQRGDFIVNAVLDATLAEIARSGLNGIKVSDIAKTADVNKTSIYRRWPEVDDLIIDAIQRSLTGLATDIVFSGDMRRDLEILVDEIAVLATSDLGRALTQIALSEKRAGELIRRATQGADAPPMSPLQVLFATSTKQAGVTDPQIEALTSLVSGAVMHRAMVEHRPLDGVWKRTIVDLLCYGLRDSA